MNKDFYKELGKERLTDESYRYNYLSKNKEDVFTLLKNLNRPPFQKSCLPSIFDWLKHNGRKKELEQFFQECIKKHQNANVINGFLANVKRARIFKSRRDFDVSVLSDECEQSEYFRSEAIRDSRDDAKNSVSFSDLEEATDNFDGAHQIGFGAFGDVYKAKSSFEKRLVAEVSDEPEQSEYFFSEDARDDARNSVPFSDLEEATNNFDDAHRIGFGAFGDVYKAEVLFEKRPLEVAVKKFKFDETKPLYRLSKLRTAEVRASAKIEHENIIKHLGQSRDGENVCLVYELMHGGNLKEAMAKSNLMSPEYRLKLTVDVARGMHFLHTSCGIIHRDVKSANVLLGRDDGCAAKLGDFGFSLRREHPDKWFIVDACAGTIAYMAPEALKGRVSTKTDVYAVGMILFEILSGRPVYDKDKQINLISYARDLQGSATSLKKLFDRRVQWTEGVARRLQSLAFSCTDFDAHRRPSMREVYEALRDLMCG